MILTYFVPTFLQFQDAITSPAGRMKLIDSMEKIVKGSQQVILFLSCCLMQLDLKIMVYRIENWAPTALS